MAKEPDLDQGWGRGTNVLEKASLNQLGSEGQAGVDNGQMDAQKAGREATGCLGLEL